MNTLLKPKFIEVVSKYGEESLICILPEDLIYIYSRLKRNSLHLYTYSIHLERPSIKLRFDLKEFDSEEEAKKYLKSLQVWIQEGDIFNE